MTQVLLLPHRFKKIGWLILIPATILGIYVISKGFSANLIEAKVFSFLSTPLIQNKPPNHAPFSMIYVDVTNTIAGVLFLLGSIFVGFSKEKKEDEFIEKLRLSSLLWAVWVSNILLLIGFLFFYDLSFFNIMIYNMFTVQIIFIARFNYILFQNRKGAGDEK
jgi:uncharacterized protein YacL